MKMKHGIFSGAWLMTFALAMGITPSQIAWAEESVLNQQIAQAEAPKGKPEVRLGPGSYMMQPSCS